MTINVKSDEKKIPIRVNIIFLNMIFYFNKQVSVYFFYSIFQIKFNIYYKLLPFYNDITIY